MSFFKGGGFAVSVVETKEETVISFSESSHNNDRTRTKILTLRIGRDEDGISHLRKVTTKRTSAYREPEGYGYQTYTIDWSADNPNLYTETCEARDTDKADNEVNRESSAAAGLTLDNPVDPRAVLAALQIEGESNQYAFLEEYLSPEFGL